MFHAIQGAWDARDATALAALVGKDLLVEWHRRLDDFTQGWHNRVRVITGPGGALRRMTNRRRDEGGPDRRPHLREPRTGLRRGSGRHADHASPGLLADDDGPARVLDARQARPALDPPSMSIEQDAEGDPPARAPLVRVALGRRPREAMTPALVEARRRRGAPRRGDATPSTMTSARRARHRGTTRPVARRRRFTRADVASPTAARRAADRVVRPSRSTARMRRLLVATPEASTRWLSSGGDATSAG